MNILDVTRYYDYIQFTTDDLYGALVCYFQTRTDGEIRQAGLSLCERNRPIIQRIAADQASKAEANLFFEELRAFRRQYLNKQKGAHL